MQQNELMHYGVLGMKWGVRRAQKKEYGMSKRQLKKAIRKSGTDNISKVTDEWSSEIHSNANYKKLGERSNKVAKALLKSEEDDFRRNPEANPSKKTMDLYDELNKIDDQMRKIEKSVGKKYVDKFNEARLKDIKYSGTVEKGSEMLKKYGQQFTVRPDGSIRAGYGFGRDFIYDDRGNEYIRPYNL